MSQYARWAIFKEELHAVGNLVKLPECHLYRHEQVLCVVDIATAPGHLARDEDLFVHNTRHARDLDKVGDVLN